MYPAKFKKEFVAEEHDLLVKVDRHTSEALVKATVEEGDTITVDQDAFKTGKDISLRVKKGEKCTIEFPIRPQVLKMTGNI